MKPFLTLVLFLDSLLPRPENEPEPRREKRKSCITCSEVLYYLLGTTPFFPQNWGINYVCKEIPNLGIAYWQCFYTEIIGGNLKGNYDAVGFAFNPLPSKRFPIDE